MTKFSTTDTKKYKNQKEIMKLLMKSCPSRKAYYEIRKCGNKFFYFCSPHISLDINSPWSNTQFNKDDGRTWVNVLSVNGDKIYEREIDDGPVAEAAPDIYRLEFARAKEWNNMYKFIGVFELTSIIKEVGADKYNVYKKVSDIAKIDDQGEITI